MRVSPYVAIVIGSKNMLMKVYEISSIWAKVIFLVKYAYFPSSYS